MLICFILCLQKLELLRSIRCVLGIVHAAVTSTGLSRRCQVIRDVLFVVCFGHIQSEHIIQASGTFVLSSISVRFTAVFPFHTRMT